MTKPLVCDPDPRRTWNRKNYDETILSQLSVRERSELEADRDLDKPVEQLVCDVHEETHDTKRDSLANIAGAQKRMTSMMAKIAKSNDRLGKNMLALTIAILVLTLVMTIKMFIK